MHDVSTDAIHCFAVMCCVVLLCAMLCWGCAVMYCVVLGLCCAVLHFSLTYSLLCDAALRNMTPIPLSPIPHSIAPPECSALRNMMVKDIFVLAAEKIYDYITSLDDEGKIKHSNK